MICGECGERARVTDSRPFGSARFREYKCRCGWFTWTVEREATLAEVQKFKVFWNSEVKKYGKDHKV